MNSKTLFLSLFAIAAISTAQAFHPLQGGTRPVLKGGTSPATATEKHYFPVTDVATRGTDDSAVSETLSAAGYMVSETIPSFITMLMAMLFM